MQPAPGRVRHRRRRFAELLVEGPVLVEALPHLDVDAREQVLHLGLVLEHQKRDDVAVARQVTAGVEEIVDPAEVLGRGIDDVAVALAFIGSIP